MDWLVGGEQKNNRLWTGVAILIFILTSVAFSARVKVRDVTTQVKVSVKIAIFKPVPTWYYQGFFTCEVPRKRVVECGE